MVAIENYPLIFSITRHQRWRGARHKNGSSKKIVGKFSVRSYTDIQCNSDIFKNLFVILTYEYVIVMKDCQMKEKLTWNKEHWTKYCKEVI